MKVSIPDCFMIAFAAGLAFGLVYEALRIVRLIVRFRYVVFVCDVVFFLLAAMAVCRLSEFIGNYVRLYTVLGFGAGVFTYIVTLGRLFNIIEGAAAAAFRKTFGRLTRRMAAFFAKSFGKISQKARLLFVYVNDLLNGMSKKRAEHLKSSGKMVYNTDSNLISKEGEEKYVIKANVTKNT